MRPLLGPLIFLAALLEGTAHAEEKKEPAPVVMESFTLSRLTSDCVAAVPYFSIATLM